MSSWQSKHHCPHCKQSLRAIHPKEVRAAVNLLRKLSSETAYEDSEFAILGSDSGFRGLAQLADLQIECTTKHIKLWEVYKKVEGKYQEYYKLRRIELAKAAQLLSDGWLPVGYILDTARDVTCNCANDKTNKNNKCDKYCHNFWQKI